VRPAGSASFTRNNAGAEFSARTLFEHLQQAINQSLPVPITIDLSQVLFLTNANELDPIQPAFRDRMEIIHLSSYTLEEKIGIAERHLIAQNYCSFRYPVREVAPGVSIVNFHYAYPEAARLNYGLGKVLAYDETGFAGRDDSFYRKQAWNFLLAGGGTFNNLDYSFTVGHEDGTDTAPNGPGGGSAALRRQLGILSGFLRSFDLVKMRPDPLAVAAAPGLYTQTLSVPGEQYAVYATGAGPARLELAIPAGEYAAEWIDTKTGAVLKRERVTTARGTLVLTSPAFEDDIALRVGQASRPAAGLQTRLLTCRGLLPRGGHRAQCPVRQIQPAVVAGVLHERDGLDPESALALELRPAPFRLFVGPGNLIRGQVLRQRDMRMVAERLGKPEMPVVEPVVNPLEFLPAAAETNVDYRGRLEDLDFPGLDLEGGNIDPLFSRQERRKCVRDAAGVGPVDERHVGRLPGESEGQTGHLWGNGRVLRFAIFAD